MKKILIGAATGVAVFSLLGAALPFVASAATLTVGNDTTARSVTDSYSNFTIIDTNHPSTGIGTLTSFSYYAANTNPFRFVVVDTNNMVQWVSGEITPSSVGVGTYTPGTPVFVGIGWNVGLYFKNTGTVPFDWGGSAAEWTPNNAGLPTVGQTLAYQTGFGPSISDRTYSFVATGNIIAPTLNWGSELNAAACAGRKGPPVVNVVQKVQNDVDSGVAGNYWAYDNLNRQIQVWSTGTSNSYCAIVRYEGQFSAVAGETAPEGTGVLSGTETGPFLGGYQATFTADLLQSPKASKHGFIGSADYQCDIAGNCPGYVDWTSLYFSGLNSFAQPWWGWIYYGGDNGTWVNSSDGNSGNIL